MLTGSLLSTGFPEPAIAARWAIPAFLFLAVSGWASGRWLTRWLGWAIGVLFLSLALALALEVLLPAPGGIAEGVARTCAALCLLWTVIGAIRTQVLSTSLHPAGASVSNVVYTVALLLGVAAAIILAVLLAMRGIVVAVELINGLPWLAPNRQSFHPAGLGPLACLALACVIALGATRDRRLATCLLFCVSALASWYVLLAPAVAATEGVGYQRTGSTIALALVNAVILLGAAGGTAFADRRCRLAGRADAGDSTAEPGYWPGLTVTVTVITFGLVLILGFHLAVPVPWGDWGLRTTALSLATASALAAAGGFMTLARDWSTALADGAMGLASFSLCFVALAFVPARPMPLAELYPMIFNATMVGLITGTGVWIWLATRWRDRPDDRPDATTTARLVPTAKHFAFLTAALAIVIGAIVAIWPRLPSVAATDDSFGRVTAGFAVNLWVLLVILWGSRRMYRPTFHALSIMAVMSMGGFLLARLLPFNSGVGE